MKVLVTGSSGFLGGAFLDYLKRKNVECRTYDHRHPESLLFDFDAIVHFGGVTPKSHTAGAGIAADEYVRANVEGTALLLDAVSKHARLARFVNIGSAAEYGTSTTPIAEDTPEHPLTHYGKSKLEQTKLIERFARERGVKTINLRLFNVLGVPRIASNSAPQAPPTITEHLLARFGEPFDGVIEVSHGGDVRDYVALEDVMEAIFAALHSTHGGRYEVVNVCSGVGTSLSDLVALFGHYLNKDYQLKELASMPSYSVGIPAKARLLLDWQPKLSVSETVGKLVGAKSRVLVVGAGDAGHKVVNEIKREGRTDILIVGFVDDDTAKRGLAIDGARVLGIIDDLPRLITETEADHILISTPSVGRELVARVTTLVPPGFPIKVLPSISSVILGRVNLSYIRDIAPTDLIGRPLVRSDQQFISRATRGKTFLVTGGAGSIGSEIVRQLYGSSENHIVVVDAWEEGAFNLLEEFGSVNGAGPSRLSVCVGNIRDKRRLDQIFAQHRVDVVIHAAAYKHVPLMEVNPTEAHKTNYLGTKNVLECVVRHGVKDVVLISTDKAVKPTSVLGKTKRAAELLVRAYARKYPNHRFCAVRFGNVLHSSGSVIPKFLRQIRERSAITITHRDMTRYFMSIPEAASLVLLSWIVAKNGQIMVLDMGQPTKILDLAVHLIRMHGLEPYVDITIKEIGIRPGEKIHEELAYDTGAMKPSAADRIFIAEEL